MANHANPPQFDLFETGPELPSKRMGRPPHIPSPEQKLLANELKARGAKVPVIAQALGVCKNTVMRYYAASNRDRLSRGRPRHSPTPARRRIVRRAILGGMRPADVAKLIGISVPTLRLHYRDELQP